ncbi:toxin [Streptomyces fumigatiscleroticus]|nr:toxin [Streptomyces fumigatiscleroticus]
MNSTELTWFKSSYSSASGDDCVEVALSWRKSSYSSGGSGDCVEIAPCPHTVHVRDSKDKQGAHLTLSPSTWTEFLAHLTK